MYLPRALEQHLNHYLKIFPVTALLGPRQSGKSTLLQHLLGQKYQYVSFDDDANAQWFVQDPEGFMQAHNRHVIFDEVQKVPKLLDAIKIVVDANRSDYGRFIVTGSQQFSMHKQITESLAGRIGMLTLLPLQYRELPEQQRSTAVYSGSYPEVVTRQYQYHREWYSSYMQSYLEKDVRDLARIGDLNQFRRLIELLAANASQLLNYQHYANDIGVAVNTIKRWISILQASYIIFLLPPFHANLNKRITKSPKLYFYDTGLVCYLTGIRNEEHFEKGPMTGALFENYVVSEVAKNNYHQNLDLRLYYLRTSNGVEADLILDHGQHRDFIEIKASASFSPKFLHGIKTFKQEQDQGFLIYRGKERSAHNNIYIMNYQDYLAE